MEKYKFVHDEIQAVEFDDDLVSITLSQDGHVDILELSKKLF